MPVSARHAGERQAETQSFGTERNMTQSSKAWYEGGCHCGAVRFKVRIEVFEALECNCSICSKKGFINLISAPDDFVLLRGRRVHDGQLNAANVA